MNEISKISTEDIIDKHGYAERWGFSKRTIDNFISRGMPHLKIGTRRVRIIIPEADAWVHENFGASKQNPAKIKTLV
jgi:hypothetical protein